MVLFAAISAAVLGAADGVYAEAGGQQPPGDDASDAARHLLPHALPRTVTGPPPLPVPAAPRIVEALPLAAAQDVPPDAPSSAEAELRAALQRLVDGSALGHLAVSALVTPLGVDRALYAHAPSEQRVPASNAKLLTTAAAALSLGDQRFFTEISRDRRGRLYLWGSGDPLLSREDLRALVRTLKRRGVRQVREVVVDDGHFGARRLAPGFEAFDEASRYRPTCGALNLDGNTVRVRVSAPPGRRYPRVDIYPPSDYVKVRKLVRFARGRGQQRLRRVSVRSSHQGQTMWLTVAGRIGRRARPWSTRRAVFDPALNAGWALRRALVEAGVRVGGTVRRARRPARRTLLAHRSRSVAEVIERTNRFSDNLAAEILLRAMAEPASAGSWSAGLRRMREVLGEELNLRGFVLGNGSGLHRASRVSARSIVDLLQEIHIRPGLRRLLLPSLAVAARSGTLRRRLRGTAAESVLIGKTGTLAGALALSGYVGLETERPLVFSLLVNGSSERVVRDAIDRFAVLLARFARGLPLETAVSAK